MLNGIFSGINQAVQVKVVGADIVLAVQHGLFKPI